MVLLIFQQLMMMKVTDPLIQVMREIDTQTNELW